MIMKYIFLLIAVFTFRFSVALSQEQRRIIVDSLVKQTVVKKDIRYNQSGLSLLLDIYYPPDYKGEALPCIVWIHGDGIDTTRIGVAGESAGGYLTGFCAFAGNSNTFKTKDWQNYSNRINCAVLWYPATNHKGYYMLDYISEDDVPVMLIHGDNDRLVHICHSYLIEKSCKDNNVPVEMVIIENADHGFFINLSDPFAKFDLYRKNMERAVYLTIDYFKRMFSF